MIVEKLGQVRGRVVCVLSDRDWTPVFNAYPHQDLEWLLKHKIGRDLVVWDDHNLWTNAGYAAIASHLANGATAIPGYIGVGTSATAPAAADTSLGFEIKRIAVASQSVQNTYTTRIVASFDGNTANQALTEAGLLDTAGAAGTATAGGASTLTDGGAAWSVNQWSATTPASSVEIIGGTGWGQKRTIASNTATVLTVTAPWGTNPDSSSIYQISSPALYAHAAIGVVKVSGQVLNVIWLITQPNN